MQVKKITYHNLLDVNQMP